eukprot:1006032_1
MVAKRGTPYAMPVIVHHPLEDSFTVSNVRNFAEFEVNAPDLGYQISDAGQDTYRVDYQPTAQHRVKLNFAGQEIGSFIVSKNTVEEEIVNAAPALLEAAQPTFGVQHIEPGSKFKLLGMTDYNKLEIIAPGLQHTVFMADGGMIVKYTPTGVHNVEIIYDGALVDEFELMPKTHHRGLMRARAVADEDDEKVAEEAQGEIVRASTEPLVSQTKLGQFTVSNITEPHLLEIEAPALAYKISHDGASNTCYVDFEKDSQKIPVKVMYRGEIVSGGNFALVPGAMEEATVADTMPEALEAEPEVKHDLKGKSFDVVNVPDYDLLEIEAPLLDYKIIRGRTANRFVYEGTQPIPADVKVSYDGKVVSRGLFRLSPGPDVEQDLEGKSFTVVNIPDFELLKVEAPELQYQQYKVMPRGNAYRFKYDGTAPVPAYVKVLYGGKMIKHGNFLLKPSPDTIAEETERRAPVARRIRRGRGPAAQPGVFDTTGMRELTRHVPVSPTNALESVMYPRVIQHHVPNSPTNALESGMRVMTRHVPASPTNALEAADMRMVTHHVPVRPTNRGIASGMHLIQTHVPIRAGRIARTAQRAIAYRG